MIKMLIRGSLVLWTFLFSVAAFADETKLVITFVRHSAQERQASERFALNVRYFYQDGVDSKIPVMCREAFGTAALDPVSVTQDSVRFEMPLTKEAGLFCRAVPAKIIDVLFWSKNDNSLLQLLAADQRWDDPSDKVPFAKASDVLRYQGPAQTFAPFRMLIGAHPHSRFSDDGLVFTIE